MFFISKDKLKKIKKRVSPLINKIKFCLQRNINKDDIEEFVKLLKLYNVKTVKDLELIIRRFQNKRTLKVSNDNFFNNLSLLFRIAAFLTTIYNNETDTFSIYLSSIYILIAFLIIVLFMKENKTIVFWNKYHDSFYEEIENNLIYLYLNFDKYF